tara:strand:+ start:752 stop:1870 length:1119 start_codon:yes stop_codon:yes gene_type:complete
MKYNFRTLVFLTSLVLVSCVEKDSGNHQFTKAYIALQGSDKIAIIDVDNGELINEVEVDFINTGDRPHYIVIDEIHRAWYVTLISSGYVCKFDLDTDQLLDSVFVGNQPALMDIDRERQILYVSRFMPMPSMGMDGTSSQLIHQIDAQTMVILNTENVGASSPHGIALSNDGSTLWVASNEASHFFKIPTSTFGLYNNQAENFQLGYDVPANYEINDNIYNALELILSNDNSQLFVSCSGKGEVRIFDTLNGDSLKYYSTGIMPWHMAISRDDRYLYTTNRMSNNVVQIDLLSGDARAFTMENLIMPHGIALTADDSKLLVGSSMGDTVYIVDAQSMILLHSIYFSDINMDMDGDMNMNSMHMPTGLAIVQE